MCVLLCGKNMMFFLTKMRVSLWLGECIYTYGYIYISTLMMMMMISWGTFFSEVLSSCFFWKGNNTFDGKIIVTWLKIARLCGCLAYQGHNIYDVRSQSPLVCMSEMIFFFKEKKKSDDFFGPSCVSWSRFISSERKRLIFFSWMMQMFHHVWFSLYSFIFWAFVTLWWWRDVMWRWVLYYFCTFVYKPVKKSLNSNNLCLHTFLPHLPSRKLHPPPPSPAYFIKGWFGKHTPSLSLSLSTPSLSSKPGPTQIPILSLCHSSGLILSLPG